MMAVQNAHVRLQGVEEVVTVETHFQVYVADDYSFDLAVYGENDELDHLLMLMAMVELLI